MSKDINYKRMINSGRWLQLRKQKLSSNPLCEDCLERGLYVSAREVHHVQPCERAKSIAEMQRLMYDYNNLKSLCHECHVEAHKTLRSHTKESMLENVKKNVQRFIERFLD